MSAEEHHTYKRRDSSYSQYPPRVILVICDASDGVPLVGFWVKSGVGHVGVASAWRLALASRSAVAHEITNLGALVFLFCDLAFAVAHEEEQANGDTGNSDNADDNASSNTSDIGTGSAAGLGGG